MNDTPIWVRTCDHHGCILDGPHHHGLWCRTCGNPIENGRCICWGHLAEAFERYLGMDFDAAAQMAAEIWDADADKEYVWANEYADTHDVPVYAAPDEPECTCPKNRSLQEEQRN